MSCSAPDTPEQSSQLPLGDLKIAEKLLEGSGDQEESGQQVIMGGYPSGIQATSGHFGW